jgi:hypothetical protein
MDERDGEYAVCVQPVDMDCKKCMYNPFPDKVVPEDRVLHNNPKGREI